MGILTPDMKRVVVDNKRRIFPNNREKTGKITKYYMFGLQIRRLNASGAGAMG